MAWFASALKSACTADLAAQNVMALNTLQGLQAFPLMLTAGCLADQVTNTYCYVEAAHAASPADLFFYQLPQGLPLPNGTQPSCSSCVKSLMAAYATALEGDSEGLGDLRSVYGAAEQKAVAQCGAGYAQSTASVAGGASNGAGRLRVGWSWGALVVFGVAAACSVL